MPGGETKRKLPPDAVHSPQLATNLNKLASKDIWGPNMDKELKEMNSSETQSWKLFTGKCRLQNSNIHFG